MPHRWQSMANDSSIYSCHLASILWTGNLNQLRHLSVYKRFLPGVVWLICICISWTTCLDNLTKHWYISYISYYLVFYIPSPPTQDWVHVCIITYICFKTTITSNSKLGKWLAVCVYLYAIDRFNENEGNSIFKIRGVKYCCCNEKSRDNCKVFHMDHVHRYRYNDNIWNIVSPKNQPPLYGQPGSCVWMCNVLMYSLQWYIKF